jgi:hypothetical protein
VTKDEAQQILAALEGIRGPYNATIPAFVDAQQTFGAQLTALVRTYNGASSEIRPNIDTIKAICARYAADHLPVIDEFTVTKTEVIASFDYATDFIISDAGGNTVQLTVNGPGGTAKATAKV